MATPDNRIVVRGVSPQIVEKLNYIAKNLGITVTAFLKPKLRDIVESSPEHLKKKPID